jgi:mannose-6-phosphate isomerase
MRGAGVRSRSVDRRSKTPIRACTRVTTVLPEHRRLIPGDAAGFGTSSTLQVRALNGGGTYGGQLLVVEVSRAVRASKNATDQLQTFALDLSTRETAQVNFLDYEERPWGSFTVLVDNADHKVKSILVAPGQRLSYQTHARRSEHWFVVRGQGSVVLDDVVHEVGPGSTIDVPQGTAHRIKNAGAVDLIFIEVQHGEYFGEDDIVRLDDDFGRA